MWIYLSGSAQGSFGVASLEGGTYYLVDAMTGEYHQYVYLSGGVGLGRGGAAQAEVGLFDGPDDPREISNWSLSVSGFAAAQFAGISGQLTGTSFWGNGDMGWTAGWAGGAGYGISGMLTYSWYVESGNVLPEKWRKILQEAIKEFGR